MSRTAAEQSIELHCATCTLEVTVVDDGPVILAAISGASTSLKAGHPVRAFELQCVDALHANPILGLIGSSGGARLGYRGHTTGVDGSTHWLAGDRRGPRPGYLSGHLPAPTPDQRALVHEAVAAH
jgi:hypothetical protein